MSLNPELIQRALSLSADERATLARELLLSLEADRKQGELSGKEIDSRLLRADASSAEEWDVVVKRIRAGLKK